MPEADSLTQLAERLGPADFNRLVASVSATRALGRLRYWQEELLRQGGDNITTAGEFLRLFSNASPIPIPEEPWTRERFFREIERWPFGGFPLGETPPEWMGEAWEIDRVREEISYDMRRDVSKGGSLCHSEEYLRYLSEALPLHRQLELFDYIMEECLLREVEFRPGFEKAFPDCVPLLPAPLTKQELMAKTGMSEEEWDRMTNPPPPVATGDDEEIPF